MRTASIILGIAFIAGCSDSGDQTQQAQYQDPLNAPAPRDSSASARAETTENFTVEPAAARTPQPSQSSQPPPSPKPLPPPPADRSDRARDPLLNSSDTLLPDFVRLPDDLLAAIKARRMYTNAIEVDPAFASSITADQIRARLLDNKNMIERAVSSAKWLEGSLPPEPQTSQADVNSDTHLNLVQSRLQVNGRELLLTDAIRCWEKGDASGCAERLAGSLRIAQFLLAQSDPRTKLRGQQVLVPTMIELSGRLRNGMLERIGSTIRSDLVRLVGKIDPDHLPQPVKDDSPFSKALKQSRMALGNRE